jgi:hypothetical protein
MTVKKQEKFVTQNSDQSRPLDRVNKGEHIGQSRSEIGEWVVAQTVLLRNSRENR